MSKTGRKEEEENATSDNPELETFSACEAFLGGEGVVYRSSCRIPSAGSDFCPYYNNVVVVVQMGDIFLLRPVGPSPAAGHEI